MPGLCARLAGITLVGKCKFDCLAGCLLNLSCELGYLRTLLPVGGRDVHSEKQARCVNRHMYLAVSLALTPRRKSPLGMTVATRTRSAFAGRLQRAPVRNHRAGLALTRLSAPDYRTQIADHCLKAARIQPALRLLADHLPRREIGRQHTLRRTRACHPAKRIEHLARLEPVLRCVFIRQRQVRGGKAPCLVRYIRRAWLVFCHPARLPGLH